MKGVFDVYFSATDISRTMIYTLILYTYIQIVASTVVDDVNQKVNK